MTGVVFGDDLLAVRTDYGDHDDTDVVTTLRFEADQRPTRPDLPPPNGASLVASQPVNFLVSSSFSCLELALRAGGLHHLTDKEAALLVLARATFGQHWVTIVDTLHIHGPETELEMWNYNAINFRR